MLPLDQLKLGTWFFTCQVVATTSIDDDLDGPSIDADLGMEDMSSLVFFLLMLKSQDLGDNESGARIFVTKDLVIFIFNHLMVHSHISSRASISPSLIESYVPSSLRIMVRLFLHSKDLWPRPPHVKDLKELVLMASSVGVDDEALGLKLLVVGGRLEVVEVFL